LAYYVAAHAGAVQNDRDRDSDPDRDYLSAPISAASGLVKMNDDLSEDGQIAIDPAEDLGRQFLHPGYTWRGLKLNPYTAGTDLLFNQVLDQNDSPFTIFFAFIFIHLQERARLIELCWDKPRFRAALLEWVESVGPISEEDKTQAMKLFEEMRGWARKSSVDVLPDPELPQKKTKATRRQRSRV
jgi:hypothetical protein